MSMCVLKGGLRIKNTYKAGIYIRLSREDGDKVNESESVTNQRSLLIEYLKNNDLVFVNEYVDDGYTGTNFDRPGFKAMIEDCLSGKINTIVTKDMSRLGRDHILTGSYIEKFFPENNIRYIAITDNLDTKIEDSSDMAPFKMVFNDMYAKDISKKVKASIITKKKQGLFLGGVPPYGYIKDPKNKYKLVVDDYSSKIVKRMFQMFVEGNSLQAIARALTEEKIPIPSIYKGLNRGLKSTAYGIWQTRTIDEILKNPTYIGNLTQGRHRKINYKSKRQIRNAKENWITVENTHEPIVNKELFNMVQQIYKSNKHTRRKPHDDLLKGLLFCKECGHSIGINVNSNNKKYCSCNYYKKYTKYKLCTPHSILYGLVEKIVLEKIKLLYKQVDSSNFEDTLKNKVNRKSHLDGIGVKINQTKYKINDNARKIEDIYTDKLNGNIDLELFQKLYNKLVSENHELEMQLIKLENDFNTCNDKKEVIKYTKLIEEYLSLKKPDKNMLISIIDKIEIDENKNIEIYYKVKLTA